MKKIGLLLIGLTIAVLTNGQIVKFQGGTSISKLEWKLNDNDVASFFDEALIGYSMFAGIDYINKQYVNLSSNIGVIRKGGQGKIALVDYGGIIEQNVTGRPTLDYFSVNTTVDLKYPIEKTVPYISFGPRFDYLFNNSKFFDGLKELKSTSIGLILGGGFKRDISNLQFGLRADYYLDFAKVAEWAAESHRIGGHISVNTFTINLTIGYKLK
jgi:hypothetical protein